MTPPVTASVIIPTYNGAAKIGHCLDALADQARGRDVEIIVVDDGSTDGTAEIAAKWPAVSVLAQKNAGPAAARNRGAGCARGDIILFTDDDCVPAPGWLDAMLEPFADGDIVGAKGIYTTRQRELTARFVQAEYEDKYRLMRHVDSIDFVDTYSAAFRRERFLEIHGYNTSFPVACAEDVELSYRMSERGWRMKFVPGAVVSHTHPASLAAYLRKKYKFAFWRVYAIDKHPGKGVRDSHTPQLMKLQLLFLPALSLALAADLSRRTRVPSSIAVAALFVASTLPFCLRTARKDRTLAIVAPFFLAARSGAQLLGVLRGILYTRRQRQAVPARATE